MVPASYQLWGVKKTGSPKSVSQETQVWKGKYNGELVALKVLRGPPDTYHLRETKSVSVA